MKVSAITVRRLLNRLPPPRRASLQDIGHAAAMLARAESGSADPDGATRALLDDLARWMEAAR